MAIVFCATAIGCILYMKSSGGKYSYSVASNHHYYNYHAYCYIIGCHEISESHLSVLEKYLNNINGDPFKICRNLLEPSSCNQLKSSGNLKSYFIADRYLAETAKPCWEDIVKMLCDGFAERRLAKEISEEHKFNYYQYCREL